MANEFKHKDPGAALTQAEFIAACGDGHIFACQATGDIAYASSATVLSKLAKGTANMVLHMGGSCIPAWTASPSVTDLTIGGGCITLTGAATDIDLIDNNASALSFDASGKTGIIDIVTTNCSEGVTMSGTLGVTGVLTATGGLAGGAICIGSSTITTTGLISGGSLDIDNVLINGTTIGHTCDTDLMTVADASLTIKGDITVGVDDTGHDVKFFGAAAGAYMLYDQSCDQLEIRGASADAATSTGKLLLTTALTNINACDVIGSINFQAPLEAGSCDAILVAAGIRAVAQATFTCAVNATDLIFYTGHSEAAAERFRFTSQNEIGVAGANYGTDGQVLTSGGAGAAVAWEDAAGAVTALNNATANELVTVGATTTELCAEANLTFDGTTLLQASAGTEVLTVRTTATDAVAEMRLEIAASSTSENFIQFRQGDAGGTANNMGYRIGYSGCDGFFRFRTNDADGSSTDADIWRVNDGTKAMLVACGSAFTSVPSGLAKGRAFLNSAGANSAAYNVTSSARDATGDFSVTWDTDFAAGCYEISFMGDATAAYSWVHNSRAAGVTGYLTFNNCGDAANLGGSIVVFGDQ
jgi:hypothetical protein